MFKCLCLRLQTIPHSGSEGGQIEDPQEGCSAGPQLQYTEERGAEGGEAGGGEAEGETEGIETEGGETEGGAGDETARAQAAGEERGEVDTITSYTKPNQPDPKLLQKQVLKDRTLSFQETWYEKYPWLHVSPGIDGVLCFQCSKYYRSGKPAQAKSIDTAFVNSGYKNWKKALFSP